MKYIDRVYGKFEITEPVIVDLINSPSLQRLKNIDQAGYRPLWVKPDMAVPMEEHSRFAHSVGVYLLLFKYGAPIKEQVAGLIHDVSHSAFSHCVDYVFDTGSEIEQNHHDNFFEDFIRKTEIPRIIAGRGFDLEYLLDDRNFPLEEKKLPDLCADRIDYSLRTAVIFGELDNNGRNYFLDNLTVSNNDWVFKNFESARDYANLFYKLNKVYYSGFESAVMFRAVGDCLKYALQKGYITDQDLYTTDKKVLEKVKKHLNKDRKMTTFWKRMNNKIKVKNDSRNYDAEVLCKSRGVNPLFLDDGAAKRFSERDSEWQKILEQESKPKHYFLKFEK